MISTGLRHIHALPSLPSTTVNWLPVDVCASSIVSALLATGSVNGKLGTSFTVHNLVNPFAITWSDFLSDLALASSASFETVSMPVWVSMLEKADEQGRHNVPGLKLLGFFQDMAGGAIQPREKNIEVVGIVTESVQGAEAVNARMIRLWLDRWREEGFL